MDRRTLIAGSLGLTGLVVRGAHAETRRAAGYGGLRPTASRNTGETLVALPEGFSYNVLGKQGSDLSDGNKTPTKHDGMAAFRVKGKIRIVRNHEVASPAGKEGAAIAKGDRVYDPLSGGGTTTLTIDPETRELLSAHISLAGTHTNCAGGPTPWGSWLSCEEVVNGPRKGTDAKGNPTGGFAKEHGYIFEVPAAGDSLTIPVPLKAMGRFVHEAIAVDPATGIVYETEDREAAGFYRFLPEVPGQLAQGGKLQMLMVEGKPAYDTRTGQKQGQTLLCTWVDITDPDPAAAATNDKAVYDSGLAKGGATFARLEGCWYGDGYIYLNATNGGNEKLGQVWRYRPLGDKGELVLLFESPKKNVLWNPDNLCVTPRGGLVICEDTYGGECHLRGLTPGGEVFDFAKNIAPGLEDTEFAGSCFSPDGLTLFANLQAVGATLAIWGPWERGPF